jgi:hypothetical protein
MSCSNYNYTFLAHLRLNIQIVLGSEVNLHPINFLVTTFWSHMGNLSRDLVHGTNLKWRFLPFGFYLVQNNGFLDEPSHTDTSAMVRPLKVTFLSVPRCSCWKSCIWRSLTLLSSQRCCLLSALQISVTQT